jgi:hypothetical protein
VSVYDVRGRQVTDDDIAAADQALTQLIRAMRSAIDALRTAAAANTEIYAKAAGHAIPTAAAVDALRGIEGERAKVVDELAGLVKQLSLFMKGVD